MNACFCFTVMIEDSHRFVAISHALNCEHFVSSSYGISSFLAAMELQCFSTGIVDTCKDNKIDYFDHSTYVKH